MATNYFGLRKNPEFTNFRNYVLSFYDLIIDPTSSKLKVKETV